MRDVLGQGDIKSAIWKMLCITYSAWQGDNRLES